MRAAALERVVIIYAGQAVVEIERGIFLEEYKGFGRESDGAARL
jgi:hypothetical protein